MKNVDTEKPGFWKDYPRLKSPKMKVICGVWRKTERQRWVSKELGGVIRTGGL